MTPALSRTRRALPWIAACALGGAALGGCELTETCDPTLDPNCNADTGVFVPDTGTDTSNPQGCTTLGEGQSRCLSANSMEVCRGGQQLTESCGDGVCADGACGDAVQYVRLVDVTSSITGQHPGADIDAVALISNGQTVYASSVTDSFIPPGVSNLAPTPTEILGPPDVGPETCDLSDGNEHWVSLAGGEIVVTFGRPILSGDRIVVYECAGAAQDAFDVTIGVSARLEGDWDTLLEEATGTVTANVP